MFNKVAPYSVLAGIAVFLLTSIPRVSAQAPEPLPEGVEVLGTGPVHEAFAKQVNTKPTAFPVINKQPPELVAELPADQRPEGDQVQWIPGYWFYDDDRKDYIWISGFWRDPPPGQQWVPGQWLTAGTG